MTDFADVVRLIPALRGRADAVRAEDVPGMLTACDDAAAVAVLAEATAIVQHAEQLRTVAAGVIAARSSRAAGHSGLAQRHGHRSAAALVQEITGSTRAEAARLIRVGEAVLESAVPRGDGGGAGPMSGAPGGESSTDGSGAFDAGESADATPTDGQGADGPGGRNGDGTWTDGDTGDEGFWGASDGGSDGGASDDAHPGGGDGDGPAGTGTSGASATAFLPWHAPLTRAVQSGAITLVQQDAIRRGLADPPVGRPLSSTAARSIGRAPGDDDPRASWDHTWKQVWARAAVELIGEAAHRTVEELSSAARTIRDALDPEGARLRFLERYAARSFRIWTDRDGLRHGSFIFDDQGFATVSTIIGSALRPRRGGPRFVDSDEKKRAADLAQDQRTNDQLTYDLFLDLIRSGMYADAETVFGARRAGVRVVVTGSRDPRTGALTIGDGRTEDDRIPFPVGAVEQQLCDAGMLGIVVDGCGNPLDVGRDQRLFTSKQRIALAVRDGGCRWKGCDRPPSYCEAHHIDPFSTGGRTDVDRGILLCRFHHMQLHHGGWRITRDGTGEFVLHDPGGGEIVLASRLSLKYLWGDTDPPPRRFQPAA